jgi:predicted O-methyltransferase YrrM
VELAANQQLIRRAEDQLSSIVRANELYGSAIFPIALTQERRMALKAWCEAERPTNTLEIGLGWAISTVSLLTTLLASGKPFAKHVAIDAYQQLIFQNKGLRLLNDLGLAEHVDLYTERSEIILPLLEIAHREFDFIFIDGDHRFDAVMSDFLSCHRLLKKNGMIVLDDTWMTSVLLVANYAARNLNYQSVACPWPVPMYMNRPMLIGIRKGDNPPRDGQWTEDVVPFWD